MQIKEKIPLGLTFDDVLLIPQRFTGKSRSDISTATFFTKRIKLNIPIVSSNMDTVTEAKMAITLARNGGIGVIHRFLPIERQKKEVEAVKRAQNFIIENPYTLPPQASIASAIDLMKEKNVSGILVTTGKGQLVGILTRRDLRFLENNFSEPIETYMTSKDNLITAPADISMQEAKKILREQKVEKLPLISKDGKLKGLITSVDIEKSERDPNATKDSKGRLRVAAAIGVKADFMKRAQALIKADVDAIVVDIAHGHSDLAINTVKKLRQEFGDEIDIVAGNVATGEGTADLIAAGANAIKVGVGPGSICITRIVTGAGVPQITAIMDSAEVARTNNIPIIADGGIRTSGDLAKAIAAGADTVMIGNLLAGTTESPGFPVIRDGRKYKIIRGMASLGANLGRESKEKQLKGAFDDDFDNFQDFVPEGVEAIVPFRGSASEVIAQLVGGLRSGISYCGAQNIPEMQKKAKFIRITGSGLRESKSHDVQRV